MSKLIDEIRAMSPEERKELSAALKDLDQKPEQEVRSIGTPMRNPRTIDAYGNPLSAEEIYDREHRRIHRPYGYSETSSDYTGRTKTKYWTKEEVDAYNREVDQNWLEAKRKIFPDATLPDE